MSVRLIISTLCLLLTALNWGFGQQVDESQTSKNTYVLKIDSSEYSYYRGRIEDLTVFIDLFPENYKHHFERGYLHLQLHNYEKAFVDIEKAHSLNSGNSDIVSIKNKLIAIKNVQNWIIANKKKKDQYTSIKFDEFFSQNYSELVQKKLQTQREIKHSIVHSYEINESQFIGTYFHLDSNLNVVGRLDFDEMMEVTIMAIPIVDVSKETTEERIIRATKGIKEYPTLDGNYAIRAGARDIKGDFHGAIEDYKKAIELLDDIELDYQTAVFYHTALADAYFKIEDQKKAFEHFEMALQIDSNNAYTYYRRGRIKCENEIEDHGCSDLQRAVEIDKYLLEDGYSSVQYISDCCAKNK